MTPALVSELKRLEKEATCAPWKGDEFEATAPKAETAINGNVKLVWAGDYHMNAWDAELVLALRNAAPALLEAVETMHAALETISEEKWSVTSESTGMVQSGPSGAALDAREALARVAALLGEGRGK